MTAQCTQHLRFPIKYQVLKKRIKCTSSNSNHTTEDFTSFLNHDMKACVCLSGTVGRLVAAGFGPAGCVSICETTGNKPYSAGKGLVT